jgi:hypothetical protein
MSKGNQDSNSEDVPIVVEAYGFKVSAKSRPEELGEQLPLAWRDVPRRINQHLMRIAVAPTRLVAEVFEGVTRVIRGVSRLPSAVANRMQRAHVEADASEERHQAIVLDAMRHQLPPGETHAQITTDIPDEDNAALAISKIQSILQKYTAKRFDAYIVLGPDGKPIIVLGTPPGSEPQVLAAIKEAKGLLNESIEQDR